MNVYAILLAAGKSTRAGTNKLNAKLGPETVRERSERILREHPRIEEVLVVTPETGGDSWMQSFKSGLATLCAQHSLHHTDLILVHNAANPFVTPEEISATVEAATRHGAAAVSQPATDTLMQSRNGFYDGHIDRRFVRHMQTPQAARLEFLDDLPETTDLISALPIPAAIVAASPQNKKITTPADLPTQTFLGEDTHRFSNEGQLTLGGLTCADQPAMQANSDGDVIFHAIGRALAQASGANFSETADPLCEAGQTQSAAYLAPLLEKLREQSAQIQNLSLIIEGARPKIDPIKQELVNSIAHTLQIQASQISLSAHTGEDLSPFGQGEGLRCLALLSITQ